MCNSPSGSVSQTINLSVRAIQLHSCESTHHLGDFLMRVYLLLIMGGGRNFRGQRKWCTHVHSCDIYSGARGRAMFSFGSNMFPLLLSIHASLNHSSLIFIFHFSLVSDPLLLFSLLHAHLFIYLFLFSFSLLQKYHLCSLLLFIIGIAPCSFVLPALDYY